MKTIKFKVNEQDIKLVKNIYVQDNRLQLSEKRPFGNSDINLNILEHLEIKPVMVKYEEDIFSEEQEEMANKIFKRMPIVLQILIRNLSIKPIEYERTEYDTDWTPVKKREENV